MLFNPKRGDIKLGQVMLLSTSGSGLSLISHIRYVCHTYAHFLGRSMLPTNGWFLPINKKNKTRVMQNVLFRVVFLLTLVFICWSMYYLL